LEDDAILGADEDTDGLGELEATTSEPLTGTGWIGFDGIRSLRPQGYTFRVTTSAAATALGAHITRTAKMLNDLTGLPYAVGLATFARNAGSSKAARVGRITGIGGKCIDIKSSSQTNGAAVQLYTCNSTSAQRAVYQPMDETIHYLGRCLDVRSSGTANGTEV